MEELKDRFRIPHGWCRDGRDNILTRHGLHLGSQKGNIAHKIRYHIDFDFNNLLLLNIGQSVCQISRHKSQVFRQKSDLLAVRLSGSILLRSR